MDKEILDFVVRTVLEEERNRVKEEKRQHELDTPICATSFFIIQEAGSLVGPCRKKAKHHREREKHYTTRLEEAEKELREKGVSIEVYDPQTGMTLSHPMVPGVHGCSGSVASGSLGSFHLANNPTNYSNIASMPKFQPHIDPAMLSAVDRAKAKMLSHGQEAKSYEQYAAAFSLDPQRKIRLTVKDVDYFGLG